MVIWGGRASKSGSLARAYENTTCRYTVTCTNSKGNQVSKTDTFYSQPSRLSQRTTAPRSPR